MSIPEASVSAVPTESDAASTYTSMTGNSSESQVSANRQNELEKYFGPRLKTYYGERPPDDYSLLVATRAADLLDRAVLIHGRLFLSPYHLCFRSNIMGIITERIHPLSDIRSIRREKTGGMFENAVRIEFDTEEEDYGYGSMVARDAMLSILLDQWRKIAPEKAAAFDRAQAEESGSRRLNGLDSTSSSSLATPPSIRRPSGMSVSSRTKSSKSLKETKSTTEPLSEVAIDTIIPITPDKLFKLVYHDTEFMKEFCEVDEGLTVVGDWAEVDGKKTRTITSVMHMDNKLGPSQSDCNGSEIILIANPKKSYEVSSETRTPGIPSGNSFVVRALVCITHAVLDGSPAARMQSTAQCDWSSYSLLKSTITPAVISGQKEHFEKLANKVREWIKRHPDEYSVTASANGGKRKKSNATLAQDLQAIEQGTSSTSPGPGSPNQNLAAGPGATTTAVTTEKSYVDHASEIPGNPVMLGVTALLALCLSYLIYSNLG